MPLILYECDNGHQSEKFIHPSQRDQLDVESTPCEVCGAKLRRELNPHLSRPASTGFSVPIVVDINQSTGQPSFPTGVTDSIPNGCTRMEIRSMREYESMRRKINDLETAATHDRARIELNQLTRETAQRRENIDNEMKRRGMTQSKLRDIAREILDKKRSARFSEIFKRESGFHNRALEFDSKDKQRITR